MSTVVLTPTHMACDHTVIHKTYPHQARIDLGYPKIFRPPNNKYLIGTVGDFIPKQIDTLEVYNAVSTLLIDVIAQQMAHGLMGEMAVFNYKEAEDLYLDTFDRNGHTIVATRHYRYILRYSNKIGRLTAKRCAPYAGIGSGGMVAVGLLLGKVPLNDIWGTLNAMDPNSSSEHTSIPINSLKIGGRKLKI